MRAAPLAAMLAVALCSLANACTRGESARSEPVVVFTAASMADAVETLARGFTAETGRTVRVSAAASSTLARQIEAGAPAAVFISADQRWMDHLEAAERIVVSSRADIAANRLVVVAPRDAPITLALEAGPPALDVIAIADPAHVPAGRYAREALDSIGWWYALEDRIVTAPDVRAALRLVEIGEADAGVVYATDAQASDRVQTVAVFPTAAHTPIRYPAAICVGAGEGGAAFLAHLRSPEGVAALERHGFIPLAIAPEASGR